ncbi:MAG: helix-turn-helix domain-containing protein [Paracoccaceae bacterium]|nr:helix-turn-helix domain-containing protein [Paracoccaceae bacterium]
MLRYVLLHYADPITLNDIAQAAGITKNYAIILFKKMLGTTAKAHLTRVRISHAKMLLSYQDRKILMIALDCGFQSQSAFYEAFKRETGVTPAEFRDRLAA